MNNIKRTFLRFRRTPAFVGFTLFIAVLVLNIVVQGPVQFFSTRNINTLFSKNMPLLLTTMAMSSTADFRHAGYLHRYTTRVGQRRLHYDLPGMGHLPLSSAFYWAYSPALVASALCWLLVSVIRLPGCWRVSPSSTSCAVLTS